MSKFTKSNSLVALSAVVVDMGGSAPTEFRLCPAGSFRSARDARPTECAFWVMDAEAAALIVAAQTALSSKFLIDYDHASLEAARTPGAAAAPAAGWADGFEWREGDGLYAVGVEWNVVALAAIDAREYRYISPLLGYDKVTGRVNRVPMAALTNYPALDDLTDLAAAAAEVFLTGGNDVNDELMERLCYMLNLPVTTTPAEMCVELDKVKAMICGDDGATAGLAAILSGHADKIVALTAECDAAKAAALSGVDLSLFAPIEVLLEYQTKLAALSGDTSDLQVDALIAEGRKAGKIIGDAEEAWCRGMGAKDLTALSGYLDARQGIAALSGLQTGGVKPADAVAALSGTAEEQQVAKHLGIPLADVIKNRRAT